MMKFFNPIFNRLFGNKSQKSQKHIRTVSHVWTRYEMLSLLERDLENFDHVHVTFRTKAGRVRTMDCSRKASMPIGRDDPKLNNERIIAVYDHQNSAWRSFRKDSVMKYEVKV